MKQMDEDFIQLDGPLYLVGMKIHCWKCQGRMSAVALMCNYREENPNESEKDSEVEDELCVLSEIESLPEDILSNVTQRVPTFKLTFSKTVQRKYFANTCPSCSILSGDFFLHSEPGAPFFPTSAEEAAELYITEVPYKSPAKVYAGLHFGSGDLILENAKKIT